MIGINNSPLVSVIINCFNGERFLKETFDSVFAQTYTNWEIIFWDNCSTDNSENIAKSYGEKIKYYQASTNTKLGEARNLAIKKATGKYVCFIDCDDIWFPNKLLDQVKLMENSNDLVLCYSSIEEITIYKKHFRNVITNYETGYLFKDLLKQYDINILTSMIRLDKLTESGFNFDKNISASEEYCLFMQLASKYKIGVIKEIHGQYRVYEDSLTSKSLQDLGKERRYTLNKIISNQPELLKIFKSEFKEAFARSNYYDARFYMTQGMRIKAIQKLSSIALVNYKYFILFIFSLIPDIAWKYIHSRYRMRQ